MGLVITAETAHVKFYASATEISKYPRNSVVTRLKGDTVYLLNGGEAGNNLMKLTMDNVTTIDGVAPTDIADLFDKLDIIFQ